MESRLKHKNLILAGREGRGAAAGEVRFLRRLRERFVSAAAWCGGLSAFILLGSLFLLVSRFIDPSHYKGLVKASCRLILRCTFIRVHVKGRERIDPRRTYLFIGNHVNIFDVFVFYGYIPNLFRGVELNEHFDWFFFGPIIRRLGTIPISQTSGRSALKSLRQAEQALAAGTSILILPEGGRTLDGRLQPFKRGSFVLAKGGRRDIVPVAMTGAFEIYRKGSRLIRPGRMELRFGEPISFRAADDLNTAQLETLVRGKMLDLINSGWEEEPGRAPL